MPTSAHVRRTSFLHCSIHVHLHDLQSRSYKRYFLLSTVKKFFHAVVMLRMFCIFDNVLPWGAAVLDTSKRDIEVVADLVSAQGTTVGPQRCARFM